MADLDIVERTMMAQASRTTQQVDMHRALYAIGLTPERLDINPDGLVLLTRGTMRMGRNGPECTKGAMWATLSYQGGVIHLILGTGNGYRGEPFKPTQEKFLEEGDKIERYNKEHQ
jgi:hypothetical protein